jgi:hypothetical protein
VEWKPGIPIGRPRSGWREDTQNHLSRMWIAVGPAIFKNVNSVSS